MALLRNVRTSAETAQARESVEASQAAARYAERRLHWLQRLDTDETDALAGATRQDQRTLKALYAKARAAWPADMPDGWEPDPEPLELLPVAMVMGIASGGSRYRAVEYGPGDVLPDGSTVPEGERAQGREDVTVAHARALLAAARAEASPLEPEPEVQRDPPAPFTDAWIVAALSMSPGMFTGLSEPYAARLRDGAGGEVDPRAVGALGQAQEQD
jgi:hypothetical protein